LEIHQNILDNIGCHSKFIENIRKHFLGIDHDSYFWTIHVHDRDV